MFMSLYALSSSTAFAEETKCDVLVYGATPGGIAAAVSAAKGGQDVLLVEPTTRIGGMVTCGLSYSDFRSFESLSGFFWISRIASSSIIEFSMVPTRLSSRTAFEAHMVSHRLIC